VAVAFIMPFVIEEYQVCRVALPEFPFDIPPDMLYFPLSRLMPYSILIFAGIASLALVLGGVLVECILYWIEKTLLLAEYRD
jgi:hypothetical protein